MMRLNDLLCRIHITSTDTRVILGISDDSRDVQKDWLFIARKNVVGDVQGYIKEALSKGAIVLQEDKATNTNIYQTEHLFQDSLTLLEAFYGKPWENLCMIGVTGTNGKSSVTNILKQLLEKNQRKVMTIGTGLILYGMKRVPIDNTTPSLYILMQYLSLALKEGMDTVVMEVSSHAIDQHRISHLLFDYIIFTNITHDHLDYHLTKTHYQYTKFKLRNALKEQGVILLNSDDENLEEFYGLSYHKVITCGTNEAHYGIHNVQLKPNQSSFDLHTYTFIMPLLGMINIYNVTQAIMLCRCLQIPYKKLQQDVLQLHAVEGRLQCLSTSNTTVWIDYAHTFMAVKALLDFANEVKQKRVILVIGCGGEREVEKRLYIGEYAQEHCDIAIFTADNPRGEKLQNILLDMIPKQHSHIKIIENRWYAIKHAIKIAEKDDIIVIAGKGNEQTQIIMGKQYYFHDEQCVYEILKREEII